MADRIKFHLDEHVDPDIAKALRQHGIDITTTVEAGLRTEDDSVHLDFRRFQEDNCPTSLGLDCQIQARPAGFGNPAGAVGIV